MLACYIFIIIINGLTNTYVRLSVLGFNPVNINTYNLYKKRHFDSSMSCKGLMGF